VGRSYINAADCHWLDGRITEMIDEAKAGEAAIARFGLDKTVGMALRAAAERLSAEGSGRQGNPRRWGLQARTERSASRSTSPTRRDG
jgi:hypothetical protein